MADDTTAFVIPLHQVPGERKDKTAAARAKAYRQRKRQRAKVGIAAGAEAPSSGILIPSKSLSADGAIAEPSGVSPAVTPHHEEPIAPPRVAGSRFHVEHRNETGQSFNQRAVAALGPALLATAALALGAVGIAINGWFARSLGSSDAAGWLFLAVGVAADLVALVLPSNAARLWQAGQRATALVAWIVWLVTFVFAVTAGIGFASTNISDVTLVRASRVTRP
jgi:hypothetical protein